MNKELILQLGEQENDPFMHLYFEKDMENGGKGEVCLGRFKWDREDSNKNLDVNGFSFYLALHIWKGHVCTTLFPSYVEWVGYLFENKDAGLVGVQGLDGGLGRVGESSFHEVIDGQEGIWSYIFKSASFGEYKRGAWQINHWETVHGLKSDPCYQQRYAQWEINRDKQFFGSLVRYKEEYGDYPPFARVCGLSDEDIEKFVSENGIL